MVSLTIDGKNISVPAGTTILEAARQLEIAIPTLCWLQKVSPTGACRICAVEVEGIDRTMTACNTPVKEGIVVTTVSESLRSIRKSIVELLLVNHPLDCPVCDAAGECDLQNICYDLGIDRQSFEAEDVNPGPIDGWPLIQQVPSRCVLCEKCVKVCHETVGSSSLFVNEKGDKSFIDKKLELCEFCGNCVSVCPTGTMISKEFKFTARPWELTKVPSVCTHCASACQVDINVKGGKVARVTSEDGVTVNDGNLCIGAFAGFGYVDSDSRLGKPLLCKDGHCEPAEWEEALSAVTTAVEKRSPEAIAGLSSARLTNEENYLFQKLFRAAIGTNNIDSEARFGAGRAAKVLGDYLGLQGASNRIAKIGESDAVLVFGCDATAEAPAIDWQIEKACRKKEGKLLVANMRSVKLTRYSNSFLQYRPGSEVLLANALSSIIVKEGLANEDYLNRYLKNLDELKASLGTVDLEKAAAGTGLSVEEIKDAAVMLGEAGSVALVFGGDIVKSEGAADKVTALATLALVTGSLYGDIGGLFPVDERGNMQGLLDMGVAPESLPGHQDYEKARGKFENAWGVKLPSGGLDAIGILEGIEKGDISFLYLAGTNPLVSYPESDRWRKALEKVEFLVVQDILCSELTSLASVVLPGAAPTEKSGSVTSLDNRVSCLGKATPPVGDSREDYDILSDLYERIAGKECGEVGDEIKALATLYGDVCFAGSGRCKPCLKAPFSPEDKSISFVPAEGKAGSEALELLSGKVLFHFGTSSTHAEGCNVIVPRGYIEMNPEDAAACGIAEGGKVQVSAAAGSVQGAVLISERVPKGLLFAPHHFAELNVQQLMPQGQNRVAVKIAKA